MVENFQLQMNEYLPLRDVVFQTLRQAILRGELKPGERLMEIHLAHKLGVSRTPVREAIRKLEESGRLAALPDKLKETASLRLSHPEDTLAQLAKLCDPPITKSALNHRLRKLVELSREE